MTNPAREIWNRLGGKGPVSFDALPVNAQRAAMVYYGTLAQTLNFGLVAMKMEQAKSLMWEFRSIDLRDSDLDTFEAWHQWYVKSGLDTDAYTDNWPVILGEDAEFDGFLEDGWHRFNTYVAQGRESMSALLVLRDDTESGRET